VRLLRLLGISNGDEFAMGFFYGTMAGLLILVVFMPEPGRPKTKIDRIITLPPTSVAVDPFAP